MDAVRKVLDIPETLNAFAIIPCGYPEAVRAQQDRFDKQRIHYVLLSVFPLFFLHNLFFVFFEFFHIDLSDVA